MSNTMILGAVVLAFIAIVTFVIRASKKQQYKYKLANFLSQNEKDCFNHLVTIFPDKYICPQVSMGAVIEPDVKRGVKNSEGKDAHASMRGKVGSNRIDFLILDKNLLPEFIVELDDNSHNFKVEQDKLRDKNLLDAGLKTVRFRRQKNSFPKRAEIEKSLLN